MTASDRRPASHCRANRKPATGVTPRTGHSTASAADTTRSTSGQQPPHDVVVGRSAEAWFWDATIYLHDGDIELALLAVERALDAIPSEGRR